ncbi:MAG: alpha/beta fold hydrolase, partial [Flavobacterium sp.]|nr:alpha/beta fold hydrolase [Pedobacter sp.]
MIRHFLITLIGFFAGLTAIGQELPQKSMWQGQLGSIRLILKVFPDSLSGKPKAVFDSPDQNANNLVVSDLNITSDSLVAYSKVIGGGFIGKFNEAKSEISGNWKQGKADVPLTLIKIPYLIKPLSRPQTPVAPFTYRSENVEYDNETKTVHFGGTLTLPASGSHFPAVILITGSGQQDRDETIFNHKPFAVIADHLTKNGIAVLRVDDRGVGQTTGEVKNATSADFAKDVLAGIRFLKSQRDINIKQIGLIGHSEGGMIASMVANESDNLAFMVSMAGIGIKGVDVIKKQNSSILKKSNMPDDQYKALIALYFGLF